MLSRSLQGPEWVVQTSKRNLSRHEEKHYVCVLDEGKRQIQRADTAVAFENLSAPAILLLGGPDSSVVPDTNMSRGKTTALGEWKEIHLTIYFTGRKQSHSQEG